MSSSQVHAPVIVEELTLEEGRALLDGFTQDRLGITVDEFMRRLRAGEYDETEDELIFKLKMLAPFAE